MFTADQLSGPEYNFLKTDPNLKNVVLLGFGGSYAYGTNVETSDVDLRGVALNSKKEVLLGRDFEQVVDKATDTTIYSIKKVIGLLSNCNPNVIETLGLDDYFILTDVGKLLIENKELFLSKRCINSFGGYANQQMYRLQQKSLCALSEFDYNSHTAKVLEQMVVRMESKFGIRSGCVIPWVDPKTNELKLDVNLKGLSAEKVSAILGELNQTIGAYSGSSKRNKSAMEHGKIAKHSMHLLRLYMMCIDILEKHEIITKRTEEHDLLMSIRNGEFLDSDGKPTKEFFDLVREYEERWSRAAKVTTLPDKPDSEKIDSLLMQINSQVLNLE